MRQYLTGGAVYSSPDLIVHYHFAVPHEDSASQLYTFTCFKINFQNIYKGHVKDIWRTAVRKVGEELKRRAIPPWIALPVPPNEQTLPQLLGKAYRVVPAHSQCSHFFLCLALPFRLSLLMAMCCVWTNGCIFMFAPLQSIDKKFGCILRDCVVNAAQARSTCSFY